MANQVRPSLIRVDSDELTYLLHIIIRYEIEKDIFEDKIQVSDLENVWNKKYEEYLGIKPGKPSEGILQDVHWYCGMMGYFPTYAIGNIYSATIYNSIKRPILI